MKKVRYREIKWLTHVPQTYVIYFKACPHGDYTIMVPLNKTLHLRTELNQISHCFCSHIWKCHLWILTSSAPWILLSALLPCAFTRGIFTSNSTIFITSITLSNQYLLMLQLALESILYPNFMWPSGTKTTFILPKFQDCFTVPSHDCPSLQAEIPLSNYSTQEIFNSFAIVCLHPIYLPHLKTTESLSFSCICLCITLDIPLPS